MSAGSVYGDGPLRKVVHLVQLTQIPLATHLVTMVVEVLVILFNIKNQKI